MIMKISYRIESRDGGRDSDKKMERRGRSLIELKDLQRSLERDTTSSMKISYRIERKAYREILNHSSGVRRSLIELKAGYGLHKT